MSVRLGWLRNLIAAAPRGGSPKVSKAVSSICEDLETGETNPGEFSIQGIAEATMGQEFVNRCNPRNQDSVYEIMEADGVDSTAFSNITGSLISSRMLEGFNNPAFALSALVETIPSSLPEEKIAGVEQLADVAETVPEGMPFPHAGFGEDYIDTPTTLKKGYIVPVTKEAIFFDRTGMVLRRASQVGTTIGMRKEKLIATAVGMTEASPTFQLGGKWKWKGTEYSTYETNTVDYASYFYKNSITDVLTDHTDIEVALLLLMKMTDPNTHEPIALAPNLTLLVVPSLEFTANRIINSTEIRTATGSSAYTALQSNPYQNVLTRLTSQYLLSRLTDTGEGGGSVSAADAAKYWYLGDFREAFAWIENWPLTTRRAPPNSEAEFNQDIVARFRGDMRGVAAVKAPQYVVRSTGAG